MAAPVGNEFWKLRSKHGVNALFTEPEKLWEAAVEYFRHTNSRKWVKKDWVGKDAMEVERETETPYTLTGLCIFLGVNSAWWRQFKSKESYLNNEDFATIVTRIEEIIYTQKFEGAAVGAYNANIIARDLGLRDGMNVATPPGESFSISLNIT